MIQTPLGPIRVADAHVHFFSRRFFEFFLDAARKTVGRPETLEEMGTWLGWDIPGPEPRSLADRWVAELDRAGIDRAVLIASLPGDQDIVTTAVEAHPERLVGFFMVDPTRPDAPELVRRTLGRASMRGICLFPAMHGFSLDDPKVSQIIEEAEAFRAIVFIHCGLLKVSIREKLGLASTFDLKRSNPLDVQIPASRHHRTRFVIPHFGAGFWRETLMVGSLCPNVYVDTSSSNDWMKTQAGPINLSRVLARTIGVFGPDRILFGTDSSVFPRGYRTDVLETQIRAMIDLGLSPASIKSVLGENLDRLLAAD